MPPSVKEPETLTVKIVVPGSFCQSGKDTVIPVVVKPSTPLRVVYDHLVHTSSLLLTGSEGAANEYWFSFQSSLEDSIGLDKTMGELRFGSRDSCGSGDLTLIMHKKNSSGTFQRC
mmetsp:Transcript_1012/g.1759  ORF Transcript_1012/g.1759 Transcript_1012/m.1759 type:complete len:116 (+) Transcript_1012:213-560(+)